MTLKGGWWPEEPGDGYGYFRLNDGKWVDPSQTKDKRSYPYSYSEFFIFGNRWIIGQPGVHGEYSDRLQGWDRDKFDRLWKEHVNCRWALATEGQLSAFLSKFHGREVAVVALAEGCNVSSGYPYWIVWFKER